MKLPEDLKGPFELKVGQVIYKIDENGEEEKPWFCLANEELAKIFVEVHKNSGPFSVKESLIITNGKSSFVVGTSVRVLNDKSVAEKMHEMMGVSLPPELLKDLGIEVKS